MDGMIMMTKRSVSAIMTYQALLLQEAFIMKYNLCISDLKLFMLIKAWQECRGGDLSVTGPSC